MWIRGCLCYICIARGCDFSIRKLYHGRREAAATVANAAPRRAHACSSAAGVPESLIPLSSYPNIRTSYTQPSRSNDRTRGDLLPLANTRTKRLIGNQSQAIPSAHPSHANSVARPTNSLALVCPNKSLHPLCSGISKATNIVKLNPAFEARCYRPRVLPSMGRIDGRSGKVEERNDKGKLGSW